MIQLLPLEGMCRCARRAIGRTAYKMGVHLSAVTISDVLVQHSAEAACELVSALKIGKGLFVFDESHCRTLTRCSNLPNNAATPALHVVLGNSSKNSKNVWHVGSNSSIVHFAVQAPSQPRFRRSARCPQLGFGRPRGQQIAYPLTLAE